MSATAITSLGALAVTALLAISGTHTPTEVSPQGCRMSFMSPSYILQTELDTSWTTLAGRYSLWLYREVGWDSNCKYCGLPVLFIPGNGGSFRQVRSIASSASRQFHSAPGTPNPELTRRGIKPLDFFAVHFNEDLTAFHGPTLAAQISYTSAAIRYITSLYPPNTKVIIMGHSMGGIVGVSQLPSELISTIFTMSTPHTLPPARFDRRLEKVYEKTKMVLETDKIPILSICGGVTDLQIPSESCNLPEVQEDLTGTENSTLGLRKTVYSSALEGCWTGVGHNEMVWCHQVRWRVARAALDIGAIESLYRDNTDPEKEDVRTQKKEVLEKWFRNGLEFPRTSSNEGALDLDTPTILKENLDEDMGLDISKPAGERIYLLPIPRAKPREQSSNFVLALSQGTINGVGPAHPLPPSASVYICRQLHSQSEAPTSCSILVPTALRVVPNPPANEPFPRPRINGQPLSGGVDESEGVAVFEGNVPHLTGADGEGQVAVWVKGGNGDARAWVKGGLEEEGVQEIDQGSYVLFYGTLRVMLNAERVSRLWIKGIIEHALVVYRVTPTFTGDCEGQSSSPVMLHESSLSEAHYYRLLPASISYIHSHQHAPFIPIASSPWSLSHPARSGLRLTIYRHGETEQCRLQSVAITFDAWRSLGRIGSRYWATVIAWGGLVICWMGSWGWSIWDSEGVMPSPDQLLAMATKSIRIPIAISLLTVFTRLPSDIWLGNSHYTVFNLLAPVLLYVAIGLVVTVWNTLKVTMWIYGRILRLVGKTAPSPSRRGSIFSLLIICALVLLVIPWQVEFLACYAIHFHNCAIELLRSPSQPSSSIALSSRTEAPPSRPPSPTSHVSARIRSSVLSQQLFFLFSMTWVLPLVIPVVLVWFRTLATAGIFTHFDGDHFVFNVLGYMVLTGVVAVGRGDNEVFLRRQKFEIIPVPTLYSIAGVVIFFTGPRYTYRVYDALNWPMVGLLCCRVIPRFLTRRSLTTRTQSETVI